MRVLRLAVLMSLGVLSAHAQTSQLLTDGPGFDVAAVKRNTSAPSRSATSFLPGGRFSAVFQTLDRLILNAYRLKNHQIKGLPAWALSERYDIEAKAEGSPTREQLRLMVQRLLRDRFGLKAHRETQTLPVFRLVVAEGGPRLRQAPDRSTSEIGAGGGKLTGQGVTMLALADQLSNMLDRHVIDSTSLNGVFDIEMEYAEFTAVSNRGGADNSQGPDIFTALREQLGLRLEASSAPVEVLVVDHVERPADN